LAVAIGEQLVNRGHFGERADLGDRDIQPAFGDQVKDLAQASGGAGAARWPTSGIRPPGAVRTRSVSSGADAQP